MDGSMGGWMDRYMHTYIHLYLHKHGYIVFTNFPSQLVSHKELLGSRKVLIKMIKMIIEKKSHEKSSLCPQCTSFHRGRGS